MLLKLLRYRRPPQPSGRRGSEISDPAYEAKYGKGPHLTADAVVVRGNEIALVRRKSSGQWALPGGLSIGSWVSIAQRDECLSWVGSGSQMRSSKRLCRRAIILH